MKVAWMPIIEPEYRLNSLFAFQRAAAVELPQDKINFEIYADALEKRIREMIRRSDHPEETSREINHFLYTSHLEMDKYLLTEHLQQEGLSFSFIAQETPGAREIIEQTTAIEWAVSITMFSTGSLD